MEASLLRVLLQPRTCFHVLLLFLFKDATLSGSPMPQSGNGKALTQSTDSAVKKITVEDARERVKKSTLKMGLSLDFITQIDPEVAAILSETQGLLNLDGLQAIDADSAEALSNHAELAISLNGISQITPQVAASLARVRYLRMNNLRPGPDVLRGFGDFSGSLQLNALESLDAPSARCLAQNRSRLSLDGIHEISIEVARELAASHAMISMNSLEELPMEVAAELSKHTTGWSLNSLRSLHNSELAKRLAEQPIGVELPKLEVTSIDCLSAFATSQSPVKLGLRKLTVEQAQRLSGCRNRLSLPRIRQLDKDVIDSLLQSRCKLELPGLSELLDSRLAERLAKDSTAMLSLSLVEILSEQAALAITSRNRKQILILSKLRSLDLPIAHALAAHRGHLILSGLREMSDEQAELFAARDGSVYLSQDMVMSDHARKRLESNQRITWRKSTLTGSIDTMGKQ